MKAVINVTITDVLNKSVIYHLNPLYIRNFYFIEDLEQMFMTAQLEVLDRGGVFEKLPLTGNEIFEIEIIQADDVSGKNIQKTLYFEIYNCKTPSVETKDIIYIFTLMERGFSNLINTHYSKSFKEKRISDIIKNVFKYQLKFDDLNINYDVELTGDSIDFIIPYWKPTTTIKYLTKISKRNKMPQESGYVFYSSLNGDEKTTLKRFVSLATLLEQKPKSKTDEKYYLRNAAIPVTYINTILDVQNTQIANCGGIGGKTYIGVNLLKDKAIVTASKTVSDFVSNSIFLGETLPYSTSEESQYSDVQFRGYSNKNFITNEINHNYRMLFEDVNIRDIYCHGLLNRYAGQIIDVAENSGHVGDTHNELFSGTWLIKKIAHHFNGQTYEQKITILKNSYGSIDYTIWDYNKYLKDKLLKTKNKNV